jgi:hypothetical protein
MTDTAYVPDANKKFSSAHSPFASLAAHDSESPMESAPCELSHTSNLQHDFESPTESAPHEHSHMQGGEKIMLAFKRVFSVYRIPFLQLFHTHCKVCDREPYFAVLVCTASGFVLHCKMC